MCCVLSPTDLLSLFADSGHSVLVSSTLASNARLGQTDIEGTMSVDGIRSGPGRAQR